jgi:DNA-binding transcriptional ArsR family regulator
MAASEDPGRRRRYVRQPLSRPVDLSPERARALVTLARYGMITARQLAALTGVSERSARRTLRALFDAGWTEAVALPRLALVEANRESEAAQIWGSAPILSVLTRAGARLVQELGLVDQPLVLAGRYGPPNSMFLMHEIAIRSLIVWFERSAANSPDHRLETWRLGQDAAIDLRRDTFPRVCRPDLQVIYRLGARTLVALVEVDRGTERGSRRWLEKISAYQHALFQGTLLKESTGYTRARLLILTPHARWRDHLATFLAKHASPELAQRCWLADRSVLATPDVHAPGWRRPGHPDLQPLVPREAVSAAPRGSARGRAEAGVRSRGEGGEPR